MENILPIEGNVKYTITLDPPPDVLAPLESFQHDLALGAARLAQGMCFSGVRQRERRVDVHPELAGLDQRGDRLQPSAVRFDQNRAGPDVVAAGAVHSGRHPDEQAAGLHRPR